jgi:3-deoxy-manno-octulosonate cytidylyltransferase (CMP-KDO synthetase)
VATSDPEITRAVEGFGGEAVMTSPDHPNGTSRVAEVAKSIPCIIVVNVQGDEPMIDPEVIDLAVEALQGDPSAPMATVACPFAEDEDPDDPNLVKVVRDRFGRALAFSRARISPDREGAREGESGELRHVGLYAYRREFLETFASLAQTALEKSECLEQLRALENGHPILVAPCAWAHHGIDTPEQYAAFVALDRDEG